MKLLLLLVGILLICRVVVAQEPYYKQTSYVIEYKKAEKEGSYPQYTRHVKRKFCSGYKIFDGNDHLLEEGEYGRTVCHTVIWHDSAGIMQVTNGCGPDYSKLRTKTIYRYDHSGKRIYEEVDHCYRDTVTRTCSTYDSLGRLTEIKANDLDTSYLEHYTYDGAGKLVSITDEYGNPVVKDTMTKTVFYGDGKVKERISYEHGEIVNTEKLDSNGKVTEEVFYYNGQQQQRLKFMYGYSTATMLEYDENDKLVSLLETESDPDKVVREFEKSFSYPDGYIELFDYHFSYRHPKLYELKDIRHYDLNYQLVYKTIFKYEYYK